MLKGPVIPLALLLSGSALWSAFVTGQLNTATALVRFLIAVGVAAVMLAVLRGITANYRKAARRREIINRLPAELQERIISSGEKR